MFYLRFRKRWVPDKGPKLGVNLASKKKKVVEEVDPPEKVESESDKVLMANRFKQMQATFTAFSNDMLNS